MDIKTPEIKQLLICGALVVVTLITYLPVHRYDFVGYDDDHYVAENVQVQQGLTAKGIHWAFTSSEANNWHPLTWLSLMFDCRLFGTKPGPIHLVNLLFHSINVLLLFFFLRQTTSRLWASAFVAAVFALHPLHVESVAWISERKDVLSTMFWLLTMLAYARYTRKATTGRYALVVITFVMGLMAKPMLVTLPFVLLLMDYWPLGRMQKSKSGLKLSALIREKLPLFILSAISCAVTFLVQWKTGAVKTTEAFPINIRLANMFIAYIRYVFKLFWPEKLAVYYPHFGISIFTWQSVLSAVLLVVATIMIFRLGSRYKYLLVGWLWFLCTLMPVIGLVQVGGQSMADRYTYIPSIGIFIMLAWSVEEFLPAVKAGRLALTIAGCLLLFAMSFITRLQLQHWQNRFTLFQHAVDVTEGNYVMLYNLGESLHMVGKLNKAKELYIRSLQIKPDYYLALNNLGNILDAMGRRDEAIEHFRQAIESEPDYAPAYNNLGTSLQAQGKLNEAIDCYMKAIKLSPNTPEPYNNLAKALQLLGRYNQAIEQWQKAVDLKPDFIRARMALGDILQSRGRLDEAIEQYKQVLQLKPGDPNATGSMGIVLAGKGRQGEAIAFLEKALAQKPANSEFHNNLGTIFAQQGKFDKCAEEYRIALKLDPNNFEINYNLASALMKLNRFSDAAQQYKRAIKVGPQYPQSYIYLAAALQTTGDNQQALEVYETALKMAEKAGNKEIANFIKSRMQELKQITAGAGKK